MREQQRTGEASRALGAELAAYRRGAGYTQTRLAELIEYSRSTIANVETGRQHVPRKFWQLADAAVQAGGVLIARHDEIAAAERHDLREAARSMTTARQAGVPQDTTSIPNGPGSQPGTTATREGEAWPSRSLVGLEPLGSPGGSSGPHRERFDGPSTSHDHRRGLLDPPDVARLCSMRQHLKAIDNAHGGGAALPMAARYLHREILPLLNGSDGEPTSRSLIEVVAQFQNDVGWMAYDAGRQEEAAQYFKHALRSAHAAGSRLLSGRILAAMSHQAIYLGHVQQAIEFAEAARSVTRHVATPRTVAMLATMEACAHATAGDARQCQRALDEAADAVVLITAAQKDPEWLDFDEGGYWGHAARAYRDLGQPRKAQQYAQKSVGLCLAGHSRTRAQRTTIQATAHLQLGEVDAAAAAAEQVVREAWNLHSGHVLGEVDQLVAAIAPFGTPVARGFLDQAHDLLAAHGPVPGGSAG